MIVVVSVEALDCFDHLIWLRSGAAAAERLRQSQSTVSRSVSTVSRLFKVEVRKDDGEWTVLGDSSLLNGERLIHQKYRWNFNLPLRLEAQYYSGPLFCEPLLDGWNAGNFDFLEIHTPLMHLRTGIIDAWIGCYPDVPSDDDPDLICFDLTRLPTHLVVSGGHPLLDLGNAITLEDVRAFPSLALPDQAFPMVQKVLQDLGLWNLPVNAKRYKLEGWEGRIQDLVVGYASAFTIGLFPSSQYVLPISIPLEVGDTLIVRREYADHPRLLELLLFLQDKAKRLSERFADVRIP